MAPRCPGFPWAAWCVLPSCGCCPRFCWPCLSLGPFPERTSAVPLGRPAASSCLALWPSGAFSPSVGVVDACGRWCGVGPCLVWSLRLERSCSCRSWLLSSRLDFESSPCLLCLQTGPVRELLPAAAGLSGWTAFAHELCARIRGADVQLPAGVVAPGSNGSGVPTRYAAPYTVVWLDSVQYLWWSQDYSASSHQRPSQRWL